jgi:hypothetical protein
MEPLIVGLPVYNTVPVRNSCEIIYPNPKSFHECKFAKARNNRQYSYTLTYLKNININQGINEPELLNNREDNLKKNRDELFRDV